MLRRRTWKQYGVSNSQLSRVRVIQWRNYGGSSPPPPPIHTMPPQFDFWLCTINVMGGGGAILVASQK